MDWITTAATGLLYGGLALMALAVAMEAVEIIRLVCSCFREVSTKSEAVLDTVETLRRTGRD